MVPWLKVVAAAKPSTLMTPPLTVVLVANPPALTVADAPDDTVAARADPPCSTCSVAPEEMIALNAEPADRTCSPPPLLATKPLAT